MRSMFSRKTPTNRADGTESLLRESLNSYLAGFDSVARHLPETPGELFGPYRKRLQALRTKLGPHPTPETMRELQAEFDEIAREIGKNLDSHLRSLERDAKDVIALTASMAASLAKCDPHHAVRLEGIARKLRLLTTRTNLSTIRCRLADEVTQLHYYLEDLACKRSGGCPRADVISDGSLASAPDQDSDVLYKARGSGR